MNHEELKALLVDRAGDLIIDLQIREFVLKALEMAPDYVWTMPASTSGKHHGGETQTEHVLKALEIAQKLAVVLKQPIFTEKVDQDLIDLFYAAVILHDLYKCGLPGQENRDDTGQVRTDPMHPLYPPVALAQLKVNNPGIGNGESLVARCPWWEAFCFCVTAHMGPWSPLPDHANNACCTFDNLAMLTFLADYLSCQKGITINID